MQNRVQHFLGHYYERAFVFFTIPCPTEKNVPQTTSGVCDFRLPVIDPKKAKVSTHRFSQLAGFLGRVENFIVED